MFGLCSVAILANHRMVYIQILAVVKSQQAMLPNQSCPLVWRMFAVYHYARHVPMMGILPLLQVHCWRRFVAVCPACLADCYWRSPPRVRRRLVLLHAS